MQQKGKGLARARWSPNPHYLCEEQWWGLVRVYHGGQESTYAYLHLHTRPEADFALGAHACKVLGRTRLNRVATPRVPCFAMYSLPTTWSWSPKSKKEGLGAQ